MKLLTANDIATVSGGLMVSAETVGCAIGGAAASELGPWGAAAGCIAGAAFANGVADGTLTSSNFMDYGIGVTPLG
jgi:hypothetical protein